MRSRNWPRRITSASIIAIILIVSVFGCAQPPAPPTATPTQVPKPAPTKEVNPEPKAATPVAKETKPEAKAATQIAKEAKPDAKSAKEPAKSTKVKVAYSAISGTFIPLWVAKEKGIFEKYGLDVEMPYIATSTTMTPALLSGELSVAGIGAGGAVVSADLAGADLVIIASTAELLPFSLYVRPEIQAPTDLKGKTTGVTRFGSATDFATRQTLKKYGMEPDKDVAVVQAGGLPEIRAAMAAGGIQGSVFGPPDSLLAKGLGMKELVKYSELNILYPLGCIAASKKYIDANPDMIRNIMRAFLEGIAVTKKEKDFTMQVIGKYSNTNDKAVLDETYEIYNKLLPRVPYASVEGLQVILDVVALDNPKAKEAKPESFIDNRILKELDDSGFIKKLYGE